jgi:hypothetical protein
MHDLNGLSGLTTLVTRTGNQHCEAPKLSLSPPRGRDMGQSFPPSLFDRSMVLALIALSVGSRRQMPSEAPPHAEATAGNHRSYLAPARCVTVGGAATGCGATTRKTIKRAHGVSRSSHGVSQSQYFQSAAPVCVHQFASHRARGKHASSDGTRLRSVKLRANFVKLRVRLIVFALTARMNQHGPRRLNSAMPTNNVLRAMFLVR